MSARDKTEQETMMAFRCTAEQKRELEAAADAQDRSASSLIRIVMAEYLEAEKLRHPEWFDKKRKK